MCVCMCVSAHVESELSWNAGMQQNWIHYGPLHQNYSPSIKNNPQSERSFATEWNAQGVWPANFQIADIST